MFKTRENLSAESLYSPKTRQILEFSLPHPCTLAFSPQSKLGRETPDFFRGGGGLTQDSIARHESRHLFPALWLWKRYTLYRNWYPLQNQSFNHQNISVY